MSMFPGDMSSRIRAYESGLGPNPFERMPQVPDVMPMQPRGGIAGLFERLRRPQFPPMGGFGGFGGGRFGPPPFDPRMRGGFPGMGGGFFGGFRPRLRRRRRPRPQMPDYSKQFSSLEAKIAELQNQLAERQAATPTPDPVMDVAEPRPPMQVGTLGGPGYGEFPLGTAGPRVDPSDPGFIPPPNGGGFTPGKISIPNIDVDAIRERIENLNIDVGERPDMSVNIPVEPTGRPVQTLPPQDVGGRKRLTRGPGPAKIPVKPPSIERLPRELEEEFIRPPMPQVPDVMPPMPQADPNLLERFNTNPASVNFGLTATFDPDTGEYVTDLSGMGFQGAQRFRRQSPAEFAAQLAPEPMPAPVAMNVPAIPDEILRDVQSRGTVGPGMVPPPVVKPPREDAIKVPIKMPPMPMIPAPMPDPVPMPAPTPRIPAPMPRLPRVGMAGPGPRIR
jgi:hypothetical protein